jgi:integrase
MARRGGLTALTVKNLAPRATRYEVPDAACSGLFLVVHPSGAKSWAYRFRFNGKTRKLTIGSCFTEGGIEVIALGEARDRANEARVSVARKVDPIEANRAKQQATAAKAAAEQNTLRAVAETYLAQHAHLRTIDHRGQIFARLIYPTLGTREIDGIKRSDIVKLLDDVAKGRGLPMADSVLATLRGFLNWHAARHDDYVSPIVSRMARTSVKARARNRTLTDNELRALWRACDEAGIFGHYVRFTLLTAARRNESAHLRVAEIDGADWRIPGDRYKNKLDHVVPLSDAAVKVLNSVPKIAGTDFIFATPDGKPIAGFGSRKEAIDKLMTLKLREIVGRDDVELQRWTLHDLRRSARTLLSRAGVSSEIAERCLGHVKTGVEGTYDRHSYYDEKKAAFGKLAELIERIVSPVGGGA